MGINRRIFRPVRGNEEKDCLRSKMPRPDRPCHLRVLSEAEQELVRRKSISSPYIIRAQGLVKYAHTAYDFLRAEINTPEFSSRVQASPCRAL